MSTQLNDRSDCLHGQEQLYGRGASEHTAISTANSTVRIWAKEQITKIEIYSAIMGLVKKKVWFIMTHIRISGATTVEIIDGNQCFDMASGH